MRAESNCALIFLLVLMVYSCSPKPTSLDRLGPKEREEALSPVQDFFQALKDRKYSLVWKVLTDKSKSTIVKEVRQAIRSQTKKEVGAEEVEKDFGQGGEMASNYWDSFIRNCDPDLALVESQWTLGKLYEDYGEVILRYRKGQNPAILKVYKQGGMWRFGLVESFWTRK